MPVYVNGLELYLSEPVNADDGILSDMFRLWTYLQAIETIRALAPVGSKRAQSHLPRIADTASKALPICKKITENVESIIEKMKPFA